MRSLARRTLRATAAVAGIAAGVGLAGPAFAVPAAPERASTDEAAPAPDARSAPNVGGGQQKTSDLHDLPQLFTIQGTGVHTTDHGLPQMPTGRHLPSPAQPESDEVVNLGEDEQTRSTDVNFETVVPHERDSAMQQLDAASMFEDIPGKVLGATENNDIRY